MTSPAWPLTGRAVQVVVGQDECTAVVEEVRPPDRLLIRKPVPAVRTAELGTRLLLVWMNPSGLHQLHVVLASTLCAPAPLWELEALGEAEVYQRRAYARAADALPAHLARDGRRWKATVVDLGEGGARCVLACADGLAAGDRIQLHLVLDQQDLLLPAEVLTVEPGPTERVVAVRLRFGSLGRLGDRLHRRVLDQQRRARALERS